jgi:hypothetical protein
LKKVAHDPEEDGSATVGADHVENVTLADLYRCLENIERGLAGGILKR